MTVFVDTSALFALLDAEDAGHDLAFPAWSSDIDACAGFVTTNCVIVEAVAVAQRRRGIDAVCTLVDEYLPLIEVGSVSTEDRTAALSAPPAAGRRRLSLVDCVSFTVMRRLGVREYLGLAPPFEEQGFTRYTSTG